MASSTNYIRAIRKARGLTQASLAEKIGLETNAVSRHETGSRGLTDDLIRRYASALEVPPRDILDGGPWREDAPTGEDELVETYRGLDDGARDAARAAVARPITAGLVRAVAEETLAGLSDNGAIADAAGQPLTPDSVALIALNIAAQCDRLSVFPEAGRSAAVRTAAHDYLMPLLTAAARAK